MRSKHELAVKLHKCWPQLMKVAPVNQFSRRTQEGVTINVVTRWNCYQIAELQKGTWDGNRVWAVSLHSIHEVRTAATCVSLYLFMCDSSCVLVFSFCIYVCLSLHFCFCRRWCVMISEQCLSTQFMRWEGLRRCAMCVIASVCMCELCDWISIVVCLYLFVCVLHSP